MKRITKVTILFCIIFLISIIAFYYIRLYLIAKAQSQIESTPITISATVVKKMDWQPYLTSVGTLTAVKGVSISTEVSGIVQTISFEPGQIVKKGDVLIKLNDSVEQAELLSNKSLLQLAQLNYQRIAELLKRNAASHADFDEKASELSQAQAAVQKTQALIAQKTITAPFDGKLGIEPVNVGQYISQGTPIVSLQSLNPLRINFALPEQNLKFIYEDQPIEISVEAYPNKFFRGSVTAINSQSDVQTHNVLILGTISNDANQLYPGLFANVRVLLSKQIGVIAVPQTAIDYSLYGNSVFIIKAEGKNKKGQPILKSYRQYVTLGEARGNLVAITKGIKEGDQVVTSGQLKLDNGTEVKINNSLPL